MTTLVGIIGQDGEDKEIVFAADIQRTKLGEDNKPRYKIPVQKIQFHKDRDFAFSMSGDADSKYGEFMDKLISGKIDLKKAIDKGYLKELFDLNISRWRREKPTKEYNIFLFATRFDDNPKLFIGHPLGKLEEKTFVTLGSGAEMAQGYLDLKKDIDFVEEGIYFPRQFSREEARKRAYYAMSGAVGGDISSSGYDLAFVRSSEIISLSGKLEDIEVERQNWIKKVFSGE